MVWECTCLIRICEYCDPFVPTEINYFFPLVFRCWTDGVVTVWRPVTQICYTPHEWDPRGYHDTKVYGIRLSFNRGDGTVGEQCHSNAAGAIL